MQLTVVGGGTDFYDVRSKPRDANIREPSADIREYPHIFANIREYSRGGEPMFAARCVNGSFNIRTRQ
eukprot:53640-Prymnesium_polylepis.1